MHNWYMALLMQSRNAEWAKENIHKILSLLAHGVVSRSCRQSIAQKEALRNAFSVLFDHIESLTLEEIDSKKKTYKENEQLHMAIAGINAIFLLISQMPLENELMFFSPLICEYLIFRYSTQETKDVLTDKIVQLAMKTSNRRLENALISTLHYLSLSGYSFTPIKRSKFEGMQNAWTQKSVHLQKSYPDKSDLFYSLGLLPLAETRNRSILQEDTKKRKRSILGKVDMDSTQKEAAFLSLLKEAISQRSLGMLEKEKEVEICKNVSYYERLTVTQNTSEKKVSVEIIQYCIAWSGDNSEFRKSFSLYLLQQNRGTPSIFVVIYCAYKIVTVNENDAEKAKELKEIAQTFYSTYNNTNNTINTTTNNTTNSNLFLESFAFFISVFCSGNIPPYIISVFSYFYSIAISTANFSFLSSVHKKYPWIIETPSLLSLYFSPTSSPSISSVLSFLAKELVIYDQLEKIKLLGLEKEAVSIIKEISANKNINNINNISNKNINNLHQMQVFLSSFSSPDACKEKKNAECSFFEQICNDSVHMEHIQIIFKRYTQRHSYLKPLLYPLFEFISAEERTEIAERILSSFSPSVRPSAYLSFLHCAILLEVPYKSLSFSVSVLEKVLFTQSS